MSRSCRRRLKKSNERTAIESRIQALLQESSHRQEDLTKAQTNFETAKEKEVRQLKSWIRHKRGSKGLLVEYQEQLVKVEQAKAAYQEAQEAMFDLMDESKTNGRGSIAWKPFRRTIVTSMQASRAFCKKQNG